MHLDCFPDAPPEWERHVVDDFALVAPRYQLDKTKEYPFVEMAAVAEHFGGITRWKWRKSESSGLARFKVNDILFGKITPCAENGKVALVRDWPEEFGLGSTEFIVLSPRQGIDPRWAYAVLCSNPVLGRAISRMEGSTGRLRVTEDTFTKWLYVPVPPAAERSAIARILDATDIAIERARVALDKALLLRRGIVQRFFADSLGRIAAADHPGRFVAPGWRLERCERLLLGEPKNGLSPRTESQPPGFPTFSIAAVRNGQIDLSGEHLKYARIRPKAAAQARVSRGDILVVRGNANPDLVGKCGMIADFPEGCIYPDILKRVRFRGGDDGLIPEYVVLVWNHAVVHNQVFKRAKTSNGTLKINNRDVKQIVLPVPPKPEQARLVQMDSAAANRVAVLERQLGALERLKRGLMQDLLTGRVRVLNTERETEAREREDAGTLWPECSPNGQAAALRRPAAGVSGR